MLTGGKGYKKTPPSSQGNTRACPFAECHTPFPPRCADSTPQQSSLMSTHQMNSPSYLHVLLFTHRTSSSLGLNTQHGNSWRKQPLFLRHKICNINSLTVNMWTAARNIVSPRSLHRFQTCVSFEWLFTSGSQIRQGSKSNTFKVTACMSDYTDGYNCCGFPPWEGRKLKVFWVIKCTCRNNKIHP